MTNTYRDIRHEEMDVRIAELEAELAKADAVETPQGWRWPFYLADGKVMQLPADKWVEARRKAAERISQLEADNATLRAEHTASYLAGVAEGKAKAEKLVRAAYFEGYEDAHYRETALDPDDARMRADWNESICESALRSDDAAREALAIWPDTKEPS